MTAKADFTPEEWKLVVEGPPTAAMLVILSQHGGTFRETLAMGRAYGEARKQHGQSELLDELVSSRPKVEHERYHSAAELEDHTLALVREADAAVRAKAQPQEVQDYESFIVALCERVAVAHAEGGESASGPEREAIEAVKGALGGGGGDATEA